MKENPEKEERFKKVTTLSDLEDNWNREQTDTDEIEKLLSEERRDIDEKSHLEKTFKRLGMELQVSNKKTLGKIYKKYIINDNLINRKIKDTSGSCCVCLMFQIFLPIMEIINLIGIFAIISVMNCCFALLKNSFKSFLGFGGEYQLNFYKEFYKQCKNESIDFNVMFIMSFLGNIVFKSSGFVIASIIFLVINFGAFFMIDSFDFKDNIELENLPEGEEQPEIKLYNLFNIVYILLFYAVLFVGVGGSSMLSQQLLVDSYDKLKRFYVKKDKLIRKRTKDIEKYYEDAFYDDDIDEDEDEDKKDENDNKANGGNIIGEEKIDENKKNDIIIDVNENKNENKEDIIDKKIEEIEEVGSTGKKMDEIKDKDEKGDHKKDKKGNKKNKTEGKFDYFFLICITTIIGYFGKYYLCSILGYQIFDKENGINYRYFYYYVMIIYASCIIISLFLYGLFSFMFTPIQRKTFEQEKKEREKKTDAYSVYQIFGYTIYKETLYTENNQKHNEFCLCCESIRDCCDYILCYTNCKCMFCSGIKREDCKCCCCCCPEFKEDDYKQNDFLFCYCYQGQKKQKWFHSFLVNKTQEALIPYMTQYFFLQLFVIGFDKAYNERESKDKLSDNLDSLKVFIITFCVFFYITITFSVFSGEDFYKRGEEEEEKKEESKKDEEKKEEEKKEEEMKEGEIKEEEKKDEEKKVEENEEKENKEEEKKDEDKKDEDNKDEKKNKQLNFFKFFTKDKNETKTSALSQNILNGTTGILLVNGLYTFILSTKYLSIEYEDNKELEEDMKNDYLIVVPVLLNKFYYFTLIYFCLSFAEKKKKLELISGATLISFYIIGFNFITSLLRYIGSRGLIIIQIVFSSFIAFFWLMIIILFIVVGISKRNCLPIIKALIKFICRFFLICCFLFFVDENRRCICCRSLLKEEKKQKENDNENKIKEMGDNNLKEDLIEEKKEEKIEEEKKEE